MAMMEHGEPWPPLESGDRQSAVELVVLTSDGERRYPWPCYHPGWQALALWRLGLLR